MSVPNRFTIIESVCQQYKPLFGTDASRWPILLHCAEACNAVDIGTPWRVLCKTDKDPAEWYPSAPGFVPSDILVWTPELRTVDVLTGPQGEPFPKGGPGWGVQGTIDGVVWQALVAPLPIGSTPPTQPPDPPPAHPVIPYDEQKSIQFGLGVNQADQDYAATHEGHGILASFNDPGMISVHSQRCAYDYYTGGLSWDASLRKHLNEFRAVYGLPPV